MDRQSARFRLRRGDPAVASRLSGGDRAKARHLYMTQARKIDIELNKLSALVEKFCVHIY